MKQYNIAIVGVTGMVGQTVLAILAERHFPVGQLYAVASSRSAGKMVLFRDQEIVVQDITAFDFSQVDIAFFCAGSAVAKEFAPIAAAAGCVVLDKSSYYRNDPQVPLVVPEVNPKAIAQFKNRNIIANPNCSTTQMVVALKPIYDAVGISRINVCTYQAVSGSGVGGIAELQQQVQQIAQGKKVDITFYKKQIAFNVLPHIDDFLENGYTKEEMKMVSETQKIFADPDLKVNPTTVRVPVMVGHSEALHIETKRPITPAQVCDLLRGAPGVALLEDDYPTAVSNAQGNDKVFVGRVRADISHPNGINLWVVADNVRKGAALNAVQIAEILIQKYL